MKLNNVFLLVVAFVIIINSSFKSVCFAAEITLASKAECAPYAVFKRSENVGYTVNGASEGTYLITDYFGNTQSGNFSDGEILITNLDVGHYDLTVESQSRTLETEFAVVPDPEDRRDSTYNPLAFAAMATYTYTTNNVDNYNAYAKTISLAGVNYVREFINWKDLITNSRHLNKNKALIDAYHDNNIGVMIMIQDMPGENARGTDYYEKGNCITYDLNIVYNAVKKMLESYSGKLDAIEVMNEPDDMTEMDTADRYASALKAASIAAGDICGDIKISTAGIAKCNSVFAQRLLQNDINNYIDIYSTHLYRNYSEGEMFIETPEGVDNFMGDAVAYGMSNKRLWMTEYGFRSKFNDTSDADLSSEQLVQAARTAPIALLRAHKSGVDRMFWFIHGYLKEDGINGYGTFSSNHTPNYVYSALSAFTNALGNAGYSREIETDDANVYIYSEGNEEIACVWSEEEKNITLPVNNGKVIVTDIMGREIIENVENSSIEITAGPDIQYIRALNGFRDNSSQELKFEKETAHPAFTKAQKIVMTPVFENEASTMAASHGYALKTNGGEANEVELKIYNFNDTPVNVNVECISEGGWTVENSVQTVNVPAKTESSNGAEGGLATITFNISGNETANVFSNTPLVFLATVNGEKVPDVVTYITSEDVNSIPIVGCENVSAWKLAKAGTENNTSFSKIEQDQSRIKMTCEFDAATKNKACRMEYSGEFLIDAKSGGLSFKCTSPQTPEAMLRVWLTDADNDTFYSAYTVSLDAPLASGKDYIYVFPFENFKWGYGTGNKKLDCGTAKIKIGIMNPTVNNMEISFGDFGIVQKVDNVYNDMGITDIFYNNGVLKASISSGCAKNVKAVVLGNVFDGIVNGRDLSVNVLLPVGTHKAEIFAYDNANRVYKATDYITVTPDEIYDTAGDGAFVTSGGSVTVRGITDRSYAGIDATLIVYPDTLRAEDITLSDIVYVDEIPIDEQGKYSFEFYIPNYSGANGYAYNININGEPVRSTIEDYDVIYSWQGAEIRFFRTEKALKVVTAMNKAPVDMQLITGMYDKCNRLINVSFEDIAENSSIQKYEYEYAIPSDISKFSAYLWTSGGNLIPLQIPYVSYRN